MVRRVCSLSSLAVPDSGTLASRTRLSSVALCEHGARRRGPCLCGTTVWGALGVGRGEGVGVLCDMPVRERVACGACDDSARGHGASARATPTAAVSGFQRTADVGRDAMSQASGSAMYARARSVARRPRHRQGQPVDGTYGAVQYSVATSSSSGPGVCVVTLCVSVYHSVHLQCSSRLYV